MYIATIYNNGIPTEIHGEKGKLNSGNVVKGINSIDSFSFTMTKANPGFNRVNDKKTLVTVFNTSRKRYEFYGRVLYSSPNMAESGLITREVICESYFGFLKDSEQKYKDTQNWTVRGLLEYLIETHNNQVEDYKHFTVGEVTVTDPNDNLYEGIQREKTWDAIKKKLIDKLGGEIRFRVEDDAIYIDYLERIGSRKATEIAMSHNMKSITQENDPSAYVTRLIPLGHKLSKEIISTDEEGNEVIETVETEERLDISSVNNGLDYIRDEAAEGVFGISVSSVIFDDVHEATNLLAKGQAWMMENNRVKVKYSVSALELSLIGLDIDDFDVANYHPVKNALLGIDDTVRITKKDIDVCNEISSTIELGDSFKTLIDIQIENAGKHDALVESVGKIESSYITGEKLKDERRYISSMISQSMNKILLSVEEIYDNKSAELSETIRAEIELLSDQIALRFTETVQQIEDINGVVNSKINEITKYFVFDINGMTIGQVDSPNKVVIDNDEISILVNGVVVQKFDSNGRALIPELTIPSMLNLCGLVIDREGDKINCGYTGG